MSLTLVSIVSFPFNLDLWSLARHKPIVVGVDKVVVASVRFCHLCRLVPFLLAPKERASNVVEVMDITVHFGQGSGCQNLLGVLRVSHPFHLDY